MRRRKVVLGSTVVLVTLGFGINQLVRGSASSRAASPSSAPLRGGSSGLLAFSRVHAGEARVMVVDPFGRSRPRDLGSGDRPSRSPDGRRLVFVHTIGRGDRGAPRLFVMNADGSDRHPLPVPSLGSSGFEDRAPAWSPGGGRIAFTRTVSRGSAVYVLDLVHGGLRRVTEVVAGELPAFATWSPDGQRLAYLAGTRRSYEVGGFGLACTGLYVIDADGTDGHILAAASRSS